MRGFAQDQRYQREMAVELVREVVFGISDQPVSAGVLQIMIGVVKRFQEYRQVRAGAERVERRREIVDDADGGVGHGFEQPLEDASVLPESRAIGIGDEINFHAESPLFFPPRARPIERYQASSERYHRSTWRLLSTYFRKPA